MCSRLTKCSAPPSVAFLSLFLFSGKRGCLMENWKSGSKKDYRAGERTLGKKIPIRVT